MNETLAVKDQLVLTFRNLITEIVAATPRVLVGIALFPRCHPGGEGDREAPQDAAGRGSGSTACCRRSVSIRRCSGSGCAS